MDHGCELEKFSKREYASITPLIKDLQNCVTPFYASSWRVIGIQLDLTTGALDIIEQENNYNAGPCCNAMFEKWLDVDTTATWDKLLTIIRSPAVSSLQCQGDRITGKFVIKGAKAILTLSKRVAMINLQARFKDDENAWPPNQLQDFAPLQLLYHKGWQVMDQAVEAAKMISKSDFTVDSSSSRLTNKIREILMPLENSSEPQFILIEGAPGIDKTVLLREIAYGWGKKQLLNNFALVLLIYLRDPIVQSAQSISTLLELFCKGDTKSKEIAEGSSDCLFDNGGKKVVFLFDGYDEFPLCLQNNSLIRNIINREILPQCGLIVSSRPHASVTLRKKSTIKVDILGFNEEELYKYIEYSLKEHPQQAKQLTCYLQVQPTISNLCLVPFNIVILVYLYQNGVPLSSNPNELYHHFVCQTICRHLVKLSGRPRKDTIYNLTSLPEPYSQIVYQLSKLALQALGRNQLVFTYEEISAACPDVMTTPEAINGMGLLQAVQHFDLTRETLTFNFLHLTIQEYLAAHYVITYLQPDEELHLFREKFWDSLYANVFSIYVTLTKGQRSSFKQYLCGKDNKVIADEFLCNQLKCFHLFWCFYHADDAKMCKCIEKATIFSNKVIDLYDTILSISDVTYLSLFLTTSVHKQWMELHLHKCYIQDRGLHIMHKYLKNSKVTINILDLRYNGLTQSSSSFVRDIVLRCKVEKLQINGSKTIGDDEVFYSMLTHPSSVLMHLNMNNTALSTSTTRTLLSAIQTSRKLRVLYISYNPFTDDVVDDIADFLTINGSLVMLRMTDNYISGKAILRILQAMLENNKLEELWLPQYPGIVKMEIKAKEEEVNQMRVERGITLSFTVFYL